MTREPDVQCSIVYIVIVQSHDCIYSFMSTFQAVPVLFHTTKDEDGLVGGALTISGKKPNEMK